MDKDRKEQNKTLAMVFMWIGVAILVFIAVYYFVNSLDYVTYHGVRFKEAKQGQITFYETTFPMYRNGTKVADYTFYLRTNPLKIQEVPFNGNLSVQKLVVFNPNDDLNCNGDGIIGVANIVQNLYPYLNVEVIRDVNATCDAQGRYSLINIKVANSTSIEQVGNSCYNINVANCEILPATERYMLEVFDRLNEQYNSKK